MMSNAFQYYFDDVKDSSKKSRVKQVSKWDVNALNCIFIVIGII